MGKGQFFPIYRWSINFLRVSSPLKLRNTSYFHLLNEEEDANKRKMDELKQWGYRFPKLRVWLKTLKKASWWTYLDVFVTCDESEKMGQQFIFYDPSISLLLVGGQVGRASHYRLSNEVFLLWDNYTLPTCGLPLILSAYPWFELWHFTHLWLSPSMCRNPPLYFLLL